MKKKFFATIAAVALAASLAAPAFAVTPRYVPVSRQSWYTSMQSTLKNIKITVPKLNISVSID